MRRAPLIVVLALSAVAARAQGPSYQRTRGGADDWQARGGHAQHWRGPYGGYGGFYDPYFAAPPIVAGSYYQRPYPYHFDYHRDRWSGQQQGGSTPQVEMMPVADCPCLTADPATTTPPPVEVIP
jgi:hypothetical protein